MQCTVIEYARDVLGWTDANSTEFDADTAHPVIDLMDEQRNVTQKGGTMRLGAYPCVLKKGSLAEKLYNTVTSRDRYYVRHLYTSLFRNILKGDFQNAFEQYGM